MNVTQVSIFRLLMAVLCIVALATGCASQARITEVAATDTPQVNIVEPTATPLPPTPTELPKMDYDGYESRFIHNVPYVPGGTADQELDIYYPTEGVGPFPTILAIHGGCFQWETKTNYLRYASFFNKLGYALVAIDYRLAPSFTYPAQVQDSFCALAWIYANADTYGFDTERIVAVGESAGGYLVAMLGAVDTPNLYMEGCPYTLPETNWVQGIIPFYGLFDFTSMDGYSDWTVHECMEPYLGTTFSDVPTELLTEMSPMSWVDGRESPFLVVHDLSDELIPSWMAEDFASKLEEAGAETELLLVEAEHGYVTDEPLWSDANIKTQEAVTLFLYRLSVRSQE
ncbi:MAG TPA: alpha/beta hydrolase [Anaerolineae bacterium]|nr:alpha/beta hydrolase [Anaerolineae bacterium]HQI84201.1 alpha/beta hydrolase [Anaerolineae bacterium]